MYNKIKCGDLFNLKHSLKWKSTDFTTGLLYVLLGALGTKILVFSYRIQMATFIFYIRRMKVRGKLYEILNYSRRLVEGLK